MYCGLVYSGCGEGILLGKYSDIIMCIAGNMVWIVCLLLFWWLSSKSTSVGQVTF